MGEVESAGNGLGANDDVGFSRLDGLVLGVQRGGFSVVGVKSSDFGFGKELFEFRFEHFSAKTFVNDA